MEYALLIHMPEELAESASEPEREEVLAAHRRLQSDSKRSGEFVAAIQLMPTTATTTVRHHGEQSAVLDGPFMETKELLAGFYLLDCESLEEAIEYARRIPTFGCGAIEIRPVAYRELQPGGED